MPRKRALKYDDPAESKRFIETARKIDADESGAAFEFVFKKAVHSKGMPTKKKEKSKPA